MNDNRAIVCALCNEAKGSLSLQRFAIRLAHAGDPRAFHVTAFLQHSFAFDRLDLRQAPGPNVKHSESISLNGLSPALIGGYLCLSLSRYQLLRRAYLAGNAGWR
jgi:hypothetical protein